MPASHILRERGTCEFYTDQFARFSRDLGVSGLDIEAGSMAGGKFCGF